MHYLIFRFSNIRCRNSLLHERKTEECWLLIHGYRGYPGELVRPAIDLFQEGYDAFVPRLPGHGTCAKDFIRSHSKDWMGLSANAIADLKRRYSKVHLLGHSMGTEMGPSVPVSDVFLRFGNENALQRARERCFSPFWERKWAPTCP